MRLLLVNLVFLTLVLLITTFSNYTIPILISRLGSFDEGLILIPGALYTLLMGVLTIILLPKKYQKNLHAFCFRLRIKKIKLNISSILIIIIISVLIYAFEIFSKILLWEFFERTSLNFVSTRNQSSPTMSFGALQIMSIVLLVSSITEELFWRGYLLPLQEEKLGKNAWVLNGLMFCASHLLTFNPLQILPTSLWVSYLGHKYKNTSIPIILHLAVNLVFILGYQYSYFKR